MNSQLTEMTVNAGKIKGELAMSKQEREDIMERLEIHEARS